MADAVWKYTLSWDDFQEIQLPIFCQVLSFAMQNDMPTIWALVNTYYASETRKTRFAFVVTGYVLPTAEWIYIGTIHHEHHVGHLFQEAYHG
jgi:hypothetical protein